MADLQSLHDALASTLVAQGNSFRKSESVLANMETQPEFVLGLLQLVLRDDVDLGIRRAAAVYLKNKISRSWSPRSIAPLSDGDKHFFKQQIVPAIVGTPHALREFLLVCLSMILSFDYCTNKWPELLPEVISLLGDCQNLAGVASGLAILKQLCKFYRWNTTAVAKQLTPLMADVFPSILTIAEQSLQMISEGKQDAIYYQLVYEVLKIYKLSTSRFMPEVMREESIAKRTVSLFLQTFLLPLPESVLSVQPASERSQLIPVKCTKWSAVNISRTHNAYLTKTMSQLSENAAQLAPFRKMYLTQFSPEITQIYIQQLRAWSQAERWYSDATLYNVVFYLDSMIDVKPIYTNFIEPQLDGLLGQVLFPLMCPKDDDMDLFEDDPIEFVQKQVDITEVIVAPSNAASEFVAKVVRKKKNTLSLVIQFLEQLATRLASQPDQVRDRAGMLNLLRTLAPAFLKSQELQSQLEPFLVAFVAPDLQSSHPYLRAEACRAIENLAGVQFQDRDTLQQIFQGVLACFFYRDHLPVQVFAAGTLKALCLNDHNEDARAALGMHITEIIRNLLEILHQIDFEPLLNVLDNFVELYPTQITPFAVDLAVQLCKQFISLASEFSEQIGQVEGNSVAESEMLMASDEKVSAGLGILNSLANLQSSMHNQPDLIEKLDETIALVFEAVYQNRVVDFYPDCMSLHENSLFSLKSVPERQWQYFGMLLDVVRSSEYDYFDDAMPVLENYIVYGGTGLAAVPERLENFVTLLLELYGPRSDDGSLLSEDKATEFSEAKNRSSVMNLAVKLLESGSLQNGPMYPHIPKMLGTVILRMMEDQKRQIMVPPRYNVSVVSLVLGALFNNPTLTLQILQHEGTAQSFFDMWFQSVSEFTRVDDCKLCELAVLSLLSLDPAESPLLEAVLPKLLEVLARSLEALPGAQARRADLIKSEQAGEFDDFDDYDEDVLDEDDEDLEEYGDSLPELGATNSGAGDGEFVYERPGIYNESEQTEDNENARLEQTASLVSHMGFLSDDYDEDLYTVSPLENLDPFSVLQTVFTTIRNTRPQFYQVMIGMMSEPNKAIIQESLERPSSGPGSY